MENRQSQLLNLVVENYISTAEPVGSRFLLSKGNLEVGEATIRNDLRALEEAGFLTHPHTSAGRVPTEKGYREYLASLDLSRAKISKKENDILGLSLKGNDYNQARKNLAKSAAELSNLAVMLAFSPDSIYYTGLSNLFSQPEFKELDLIGNVSQVFDHCDECLENFWEKAHAEVSVYFGNEHPFGEALSLVAGKFSGKDNEGMFILMGPTRMDYKHNFALVNSIKDLI